MNQEQLDQLLCYECKNKPKFSLLCDNCVIRCTNKYNQYLNKRYNNGA